MTKITTIRPLNIGAIIRIIDNSGAKSAKILSIEKYHGVKRRYAKGGIGSLCKVAVQQGKNTMVGKLYRCLIVGTKYPFHRNTGEKICYDDNYGILIDQKQNLIGSKINLFLLKELTKDYPVIVSKSIQY